MIGGISADDMIHVNIQFDCEEITRATLNIFFRATVDNGRMTRDFTKILHSSVNVNK